MNINLGKSQKITVGNYSSINPSVNITIDNIKLEDIEQVTESIRLIEDSLIALQIKDDVDLMGNMVNLNSSVIEFVELISTSHKEIYDVIETEKKKLMELGY